MHTSPRHLELLAPARNAEIGIEAVNHGADAVYIGGPAFGARAKAENSVADIARLAAHAHRYHARVFVAFNTIFHDNELEAAREIVTTQQKAVELAREGLAIAETSYENGVITSVQQ